MRFLSYIKESTTGKIGLYPGRFQPITNGHMEVLKQMTKDNNMSYIIIVKGSKTSLDKKSNPFSLELQIEMINSIINKYFKGKMKVIVFGSADIYKLVKENNIQGKDFTLYCGPDRENQYKNFIKYFEADGMTLTINTADGKRTPGVSGTDAREAIKTNDLARFKRITPDAIWPFFDKLKETLNV